MFSKINDQLIVLAFIFDLNIIKIVFPLKSNPDNFLLKFKVIADTEKNLWTAFYSSSESSVTSEMSISDLVRELFK